MLGCNSKILIQQVPNDIYPNRDKIITMTNVAQFEISSSWDNFIDTANVNISRKTKSIIVSESLWSELGSERIPFKFKTIPVNGKNYPATDESFITSSQLVGGFTQSNNTSIQNTPLIQYGDMIQIWAGYTFYDELGVFHNTLYNGNYMMVNNQPVYSEELENNTLYYGVSRRSLLFTGYITQISAQSDLFLKCQDYMAYFTQLVIPDHSFIDVNKSIIPTTIIDPGNSIANTLKGIICGSINGVSATPGLSAYPGLYSGSFDNYIKTFNKYKLKPIYSGQYVPGALEGIGSFDLLFNNTSNSDKFGTSVAQHATVGMILKQFKDDGWAVPYFYPNSPVLNLSAFKYTENPYSLTNHYGFQEFTFTFQENIIDNKLEYVKTDTLLIGAIVKSTFTINTTANTLSTETIGVKSGTNGGSQPLTAWAGNPGGNIVTYLFQPNNSSIPIINGSITKKTITAIQNDMSVWGEQKLREAYYEGYRGSFTIMGFPYIRHGDQITIIDKNYIERQGTYKVKTVHYEGTIKSGFKQHITLDVKIGTYIPKNPS